MRTLWVHIDQYRLMLVFFPITRGAILVIYFYVVTPRI